MTSSRTTLLWVLLTTGCAGTQIESTPVEGIFESQNRLVSQSSIQSLDGEANRGDEQPIDGVRTFMGEVEAPTSRPGCRRHDFENFGDEGFRYRIDIDREHAIEFRYPSRSFDSLWHTDPNRVGSVELGAPVFDVVFEHRVTNFDEEQFYKKSMESLNFMRSRVVEVAWTPHHGVPIAFWDHYHDYEFKFEGFGLYRTESHYWFTGEELLGLLSASSVRFSGFQDVDWDLGAEEGVDRLALLWALRHEAKGVLPRISAASGNMASRDSH